MHPKTTNVPSHLARKTFSIGPAIFQAGLLAAIVAGLSTASAQRPAGATIPLATIQVLQVRSNDFAPGGLIPRRYTCDGEDLSPQIAWQAAPAGAMSLALLVHDPDAPADFTHWLAYDIAPGTRDLPEGASARGAMPAGVREGTNDFARRGYSGPCPPPGKPHRYVFKLFALDARLDLPVGATRNQLEAAMKGHILAEGRLTGSYRRKE